MLSTYYWIIEMQYLTIGNVEEFNLLYILNLTIYNASEPHVLYCEYTAIFVIEQYDDLIVAGSFACFRVKASV